MLVHGGLSFRSRKNGWHLSPAWAHWAQLLPTLSASRSPSAPVCQISHIVGLSFGSESLTPSLVTTTCLPVTLETAQMSGSLWNRLGNRKWEWVTFRLSNDTAGGSDRNLYYSEQLGLLALFSPTFSLQTGSDPASTLAKPPGANYSDIFIYM